MTAPDPRAEQHAARMREELRAAGVPRDHLLAAMRGAAKQEAKAAYERAEQAQQDVLAAAESGGDVQAAADRAAQAGREWERAVSMMGWLDAKLAQEDALDWLDRQFDGRDPDRP
ncbi:hypothetical protein [Pseudonocardia sp. WMMC193]|uniref:hypothetical protein n=1 Tax=Pseudonocardia sp. WMMC193 TaxID=2911965 RepID=UPI001F2EB659|nr:hypothetical protein [Pseudonocardia sp. WMMC193]MCF7550494.1 hypothetical protein [Pseudonocardia sp. WMMC193]